MTRVSSVPPGDRRPIEPGRAEDGRTEDGRTKDGLIVYKGHGTENDFVIVEDLDDEFDLTPALVRALCDRHAGVGADGVLRVVRTQAMRCAAGVTSESVADATEAQAEPDAPRYFMDYRNADGSPAEMCGNGARVFVRYLLDHDLAELDGLRIATRAGAVAVGGPSGSEPDRWLSVTLGPAGWLDAAPVVDAAGLNEPREGVAITMPNPHVVVFVDADELAALDLSVAPSVSPPLPHGQNVEFVVPGDHELSLRVHERGVGETRSCGTGIAAAVVAASSRLVDAAGGGGSDGRVRPPAEQGDGRAWRIDVPGGRCGARWLADGHVVLSGPAVIVAAIELDPQWLADAAGHQ